MQLSATIVGIQQRTPKVKTFVLDYGTHPLEYHPGQWVDIHLTIDDETHNCGYSITSIPSNLHRVEIAVKLAPELTLTTHLHSKSMIGDQVYTSPAQGNIYLDKNIDDAYVFIAGGVGITPLYSMIQYIFTIRPETKVTLIYSIATEQEFLFGSEIRELETKFKNFKCCTTITREKHSQRYKHGRISTQMIQEVNPPAHASYYLCGPPDMVEDVAKILYEMRNTLSITDDNIHYDKWWS